LAPILQAAATVSGDEGPQLGIAAKLVFLRVETKPNNFKMVAPKEPFTHSLHVGWRVWTEVPIIVSHEAHSAFQNMINKGTGIMWRKQIPGCN
jgi:hypothetical protein